MKYFHRNYKLAFILLKIDNIIILYVFNHLLLQNKMIVIICWFIYVCWITNLMISYFELYNNKIIYLSIIVYCIFLCCSFSVNKCDTLDTPVISHYGNVGITLLYSILCWHCIVAAFYLLSWFVCIASPLSRRRGETEV